MSHLSKAVAISDELLAARDMARRLLGESYFAKVAPWCDFVERFSSVHACREIEVPLRLDAAGDMPDNPLMLFAAVVELVEWMASPRPRKMTKSAASGRRGVRRIMTERPILFSAPMVRALLDGSKTQTRRVVRFDPPSGDIVERGGWRRWHRDDPSAVIACPYGVPGDLLWCRETWRPHIETGMPEYRANLGAVDHDLRWKPSIYMPRWVSRITLRITDVRVQRLQEISEEDARAEGVAEPAPVHGKWCDATRGREGHWSYRKPFADLWDSLNAKRAPWSSNPFVWAIAFERVTEARP